MFIVFSFSGDSDYIFFIEIKDPQKQVNSVNLSLPASSPFKLKFESLRKDD